MHSFSLTTLLVKLYFDILNVQQCEQFKQLINQSEKVRTVLNNSCKGPSLDSI